MPATVHTILVMRDEDHAYSQVAELPRASPDRFNVTLLNDPDTGLKRSADDRHDCTVPDIRADVGRIAGFATADTGRGISSGGEEQLFHDFERLNPDAKSASSPPPAPADDALPVIDTEVFEQIAGYLSPEKLGSYMNMLTARGEAMLHALNTPDALVKRAAQLAGDAHTIAGGGGMFGFQRLTDAARGFVTAVEAKSPDVADRAARLRMAIDLTLVEIRRRAAMDRARTA